MNILVLCPHFAPDVAPTGEVMTAITNELVALGHRLHVVTALPWYLHHRVQDEWRGRLARREKTSWGSVTRVHPFPTDKTNIPARALAFAGFTALSGAVGMFPRGRVDAVMAMSPPLTLGPAAWAIARARRAPFVFNVQDVFPDVAVQLGVLRDPRVIGATQQLERFVYRRADAVTVLSEDLADNVGRKLGAPIGQPPKKVRVIPNFVDTAAITMGERDNSYRAEFGLVGRTVVMYAGNIGLSQSLELLLHAAAEFAEDRPEVVFVINGGGSALAGLQRDAAHLPNVKFVGLQPKARLATVLAAADLHVVPLKAGLAASSVPSKLYSILAAGRAVLASVDEGTEVGKTVQLAGAGRSVPPENPTAFVAALRELLADPDRLVDYGASGRRFVEGWASPAAVGRAYSDLFEELVRPAGGLRRNRPNPD